ncbi:hypothetical protein BJ165DRAFT_1610396 [Panaeolus papilionaceus]|nr:hypothetical protein BJ165DRAFT_1610396 [Panaeolus papilionaceus]
MSGILALIEVFTLGVIIKIIIKLDITQINTDVLHHPSSHPSKPFTVAGRFLGPLTYASLGFSIPPLVTAFHHISNPSLTLVVVPAIVASVLTSLFLTINLYLGRVHPKSSTAKGRSIEMPILLLLLSAGWLACTGMGFCTLKTPDLLRTICPDDIALPLVKSACRTNLQEPLKLHVVWTSLQMLILVSMVLLYYVINQYTDSNASNPPESSIPSQQRAIAKGPRMAF